MTKKVFTCIKCPRGCRLTTDSNDAGVITVSGNMCYRGKVYAEQELSAPKRMVTTLVKVVGGDKPVLPVKTTAPVAKQNIAAVLQKIRALSVPAPVKAGQVLAVGVDEGVDVVATSYVDSV